MTRWKRCLYCNNQAQQPNNFTEYNHRKFLQSAVRCAGTSWWQELFPKIWLTFQDGREYIHRYYDYAAIATVLLGIAMLYAVMLSAVYVTASAYASELVADKPTARFNLEPKTLKMKPKTGNPEQKPKTKKKFQSLAIRAQKISVLFQNSNFHCGCVCYVRSWQTRPLASMHQQLLDPSNSHYQILDQLLEITDCIIFRIIL